uniref:Matrix Gla protein n=1 Tax=Chelonoidis abingdonii TaxID=106734 RepID=A0A8C0GLR8_CHEAB
MRTLILLTLLAVLMVAAFCYGSQPQMPPGLFRCFALMFISPYLIRERNKTPQERQREICEDYNPCERYAMRHGYIAAYKRYFGQRRSKGAKPF